MVPPVRLFDDRLRIEPLVGAEMPNRLALSDSLSAASDALTRVSSDRFDLRPSILFSSRAAVTSGFGVDSVQAGLGYRKDVREGFRLGTPLWTANLVASDPLLARTPLIAGGAGFSLSVTDPGQGDGWKRPVETITVRAGISASGEVKGLDDTMSALRPLIKDAMEFETQARALSAKVQAEIAFFRSGPEVAELRKALASHDGLRILAAAQPVLARLGETQKILAASERLLANADALLLRAAALPADLSASAAVRGAVEMDRTWRMHVGELRSEKASARLSVGLTVGSIIPMAAPEVSSLVPGLAPIRSMMVSASVVTHTTFEGVSDLRSLIQDAAGLAKDARAFAREASDNPLRYADKTEGEKAAAKLGDIAKRGEALGGRIDKVLAGLGAKVEAGLRVREATGPGGGLKEVAAQLDGTIGGHVDYRLGLRLRNVIGYLPGRVTDYRLEQDPKTQDVRLGLIRSRGQNVFSDFYAFGVASDASVRVHSGARSLELRGGVDASAAGVSAYGGLIGGLHGFSLSAGVVVPDVNRPGVLPPQLSLGLGFQNKDLAVSLSAGADAGVFNGASSTRGAHTAFNVGVFF